MKTDKTPQQNRIGITLIYILATLCLVVTIAPFIWMFLSSIKPESAILQMPPRWLPWPITGEHYRNLLLRGHFVQSLINSVIVAFSATAATLLVNSMAAFAFSKYRFPLRDRLFTLLLATMMIPGQVTMMPVFILLKEMGLLNSYLGLVLPGAASVFAIFLLRQYMISIPDSLIEAARIDGYSEFRIFWKIMIPLSMPAIATLTIFTFMGAWNEFLWALIIMLDESKFTLPVALATLSSGEHGMEWGLLMAGSVVTIIPVLIVFLAMQRYYIEGIAVTGVKE